jgi:hypothetical protein
MTEDESTVPTDLLKRSRPGGRLRTLAVSLRDPLILLLIVIGYYWRIVLAAQYNWDDNPDLVNQVLPWFAAQARAWHSGQFPLWDPHHWLGQSFAGQVQPGIMYPLNWLLFLLPMRDGYLALGFVNWYYVLIHYIAVLFSYALCRDLGLSRRASLFGAAAFGLSGYMAAVVWPQMLNGACWAPLAFLFFFRILRHQNALRNAIYCGAVYGFSFLSGHHQAPIFIGLALAASWCYYLFTCWREDRLAFGVKAALLTGLFTALVSAAQMLPAIEYGRRALRWVGDGQPVAWKQLIPYSVHSQLALAPSRLVNILVPLDGRPECFVGWAVFTMAILGVALCWNGKRRREVRLLTAIAVGAFLYSLGPFLLFHGILYSVLPMLDKARTAQLDTVVSSFACTALAAFGIDALIEQCRENDWAPRLIRATLWAGGLLAACVFIAEAFSLQNVRNLELLTMSSIAALLTAALLWSFRRAQISANAFVVLLLCLGLVEWNNVGTYGFRSKQQPALIQNLSQYRDIADFLHQQKEPVRVDVLDSAIPYNFGDWDGVDQSRGYLASISTDVFNLFYLYGHSSAPLLSANYVISLTPPVAGDQPVFTGKSGVKVYENPSAFPRVWPVHTLSVASDIPSITRELNAGPDELRRSAFLSHPGPALETCAAPDDLTLSYRGLQSLDIDANMGCQGMAIVSEAYFPGWSATVDGHPAPIYQVDVALRGVVVPRGRHHVQMVYRPVSVYVGVVLTLLGLLATAGLWWRKRRSSDSKSVRTLQAE